MTCSTSGIVEISERYQESWDDEYPSYKRIINMETDTQVFSRMFKGCVRKNDDNNSTNSTDSDSIDNSTSSGPKILQKIIRFSPVVKFKDYAVSLKYGGGDGKMGSVAWITPEVLTDFECNPDEDFDKKWDDGTKPDDDDKPDDSDPKEDPVDPSQDEDDS